VFDLIQTMKQAAIDMAVAVKLFESTQISSTCSILQGNADANEIASYLDEMATKHTEERRGAQRFYVRTVDAPGRRLPCSVPEGNEELIQVCTDLDAQAIREWETRALLADEGT